MVDYEEENLALVTIKFQCMFKKGQNFQSRAPKVQERNPNCVTSVAVQITYQILSFVGIRAQKGFH